MGSTIELLKAPTGTVHLGNFDFDQHLVGSKCTFQETLVKVFGRNLAFAAGALHHVGGTKRQGGGSQIAGGVGVGDRATDGAAMSHLCIAHITSGMRQQRHVLAQHWRLLYIHVAGECTNGDVITGIFDVRQVFNATDIHQHRGLRQAQLHEWNQTVPAGQKLCFIAVLTDEADGLVG